MPKAHPRVCGEDINTTARVVKYEGSPPRMRGLCVSKSAPFPSFGLTPAHAGKIHRLLATRITTWAHPRACGEDTRHQLRISPDQGSPPRMRGRYGLGMSSWGYRGLTPAHAGKIGSVRRGVRRDQAHPRACGEDKGDTAWRCRKRGSPPRMRGLLFTIAFAGALLGSPPRMRGRFFFAVAFGPYPWLTPAHAGKITASNV